MSKFLKAKGEFCAFSALKGGGFTVNTMHLMQFFSVLMQEETEYSDIDLVVFGGEHFHPTDIFAFGEDLREMTGKDADALRGENCMKKSDKERLHKIITT